MIVGIDANCFKAAIDAICDEVNCDCLDAIALIIEKNGHIPLDDREFILQEWRDCTKGRLQEFTEEWIADSAANNLIRFYKSTGVADVRKELTIKGMPRKDAKIISIMVDIAAQYFLSEDIDMYDPRQKDNCPPARRKLIVEQRKGFICKHVGKAYRLEIHTPGSFYKEVKD